MNSKRNISSNFVVGAISQTKVGFLALALGFCLFLAFLSPLAVKAYFIESLSQVKITDDFTIGPTKIQADLAPGEEVIKNLMITNRAGNTLSFKIGKEDFIGSKDPEKVTVFLGEERGRFSLKDWLQPDIEEFSLEHGQRMNIGVKISIPEDAEPGGYYAAIFAASQPSPEERGKVKIISRVGSLFFVKVKGQVKEEGVLEKFKADKFYYQKGPIKFELLSQNTGNVHLVPYGLIEIKNILGKKIAEIRLDPWFVMPDSSRFRKVSWNKELLLGFYTATAKINRGYQDIVDEKSVRFLVAPWKTLLAGLFGLILIILLFRWIFRKFEFRVKKKN